MKLIVDWFQSYKYKITNKRDGVYYCNKRDTLD